MDIAGQKFGRLTVTSEFKRGRRWYCTCDCDCGAKAVVVRKDTLKSGNTKSCGCLSKEMQFRSEDISGQRFGKLIAVRNTHEHRKYGTDCIWECKCDCGNACLVAIGDLKRGAVKSCGCAQYENTHENMKKASKVLSDKYLKDGTNTKLLSKTEPNRDGTSGYRNISWDDDRGKWVVQLVYKNKTYHIGRFDDLDNAVYVRDQAREAREKGTLDEWIEEYRNNK